MSLPKPSNQGSFFDVAFLLEGLFGPTDRYRLFREEVLPALRGARSELAALYCAENGRPAIEPVLLAGVTLLQFMMEAAQAERVEESAPQTHVDAAYVSGETLAEAKAQGRELIGPALPSKGHKGCFASEEFDVDIAARKAVCPAGNRSSHCSLVHDSHQGSACYRFEWGSQCDGCPLQKRCTTSKSGRRILSVGIHHDLVQQRRREMKTQDFQDRRRRRNAIEGTISELARAGMRRTRYRGLAKTALANYLVAAGCNVKRWLRRLIWQTQCAPTVS